MPFFKCIKMKVAEIKVSYTKPENDNIKISQSKDLFNLILNHWDLSTIEMQEEVKVVFMNRANIVIGIYELSKGGMTGSIIDIKLLMSVALKCLVSNMAIIHNHPSGNLQSSKADLQITKKIKLACEYLDLNLLDHLIITKESYLSFADEGKL